MPPTVLIVDDHPTFGTRARLLLEAEGYDVIGRGRGRRERPQVGARARAQVVLLDVQLPDIDGFIPKAELSGERLRALTG